MLMANNTSHSRRNLPEHMSSSPPPGPLRPLSRNSITTTKPRRIKTARTNFAVARRASDHRRRESTTLTTTVIRHVIKQTTSHPLCSTTTTTAGMIRSYVKRFWPGPPSEVLELDVRSRLSDFLPLGHGGRNRDEISSGHAK